MYAAISSINWAQSIVTGLIAPIGIFLANYFIDKVRFKRDRPVLQLEPQSYPTKEPIDLVIFDPNDPTLREELWEFINFNLKYTVNRLKVRNTGRDSCYKLQSSSKRRGRQKDLLERAK